MSIIRWTPLIEPMEDLEKSFFGGLAHSAGGFAPAIDLYQTKDEVVVETPLAGIDPKDVDISIENDILTIKGESKKKSEVDDKNYYRQEVRYGSFYRSVSLPAHVKGDKAQATYDEGMLKISIPKAEESKPKKIAITAKSSKK